LYVEVHLCDYANLRGLFTSTVIYVEIS